MIGSWEKECKDVHAVSFSNFSHVADQFLGAVEFRELVRGREEKSKPAPFANPAKSAAPGKDKRLLQSGGRVGHPPWLTKRNMRGRRERTKREDVASPLELSEIPNRFAVEGRRFNAESQKD